MRFDGQPTPRLLAAIEASLVAHMAHLPSLMPGTKVVMAPDLVIFDAGVASDTLNVVCGAELAVADADRRISFLPWAHFASTRQPLLTFRRRGTRSADQAVSSSAPGRATLAFHVTADDRLQ